MHKKQVLLKISRSGLSLDDGNRIVEIHAIELLSGKPHINFHRYINPNRIIESTAFKEHGLSYYFLKKYPPFKNIAKEFLEFIQNAELIVHNIDVTISYINREFEIIGYRPLDEYCEITSIGNHDFISKTQPLLVLQDVQNLDKPTALTLSANQH